MARIIAYAAAMAGLLAVLAGVIYLSTYVPNNNATTSSSVGAVITSHAV